MADHQPINERENVEQIPLSPRHHESHQIPPAGNSHQVHIEHEEVRTHHHQPHSGYHPPPLVKQRSMASMFHPYNDKETKLRARFRKTIDFPISSMIMMNSNALAGIRKRIPALQGIHWPHIRFLKDHPQWKLHRHHRHDHHEHAPAASPAHEKSRWDLMTPANHILVLSCCLAWCGYYVCRSHVSVLLPVISQETGLSLSLFSMVFSAGLVTTAIGKIANGMLADRYGGQIVFTFYLLLAALSTVLMTLSPTVLAVGWAPVLGFWIVTWCLNRWFHSGAWGSMILLLSVQLPHRAYGLSLSIVSLGYSGGDMLARVAYGLMLSTGMTWNNAFRIGALITTLCSIPSVLLWVRLIHKTSSIGDKGPATLMPRDSKPKPAEKSSVPHRMTTAEIIRSLLSNRAFVVMTISYSVMAVLREMVFTWTTVFLVEVVGTTSAMASTISLFIPVCMVGSANITGYVADHAQGVRRVQWLQFIPTVIVAASCVMMTVLMTIWQESAPAPLVVTLLIATCFFGELHNTFIEGFQFVALSASVNRPATVSGLIAFCSNFGSTACSLSIGSILGVNADVRSAWITIYYVMCICGLTAAIASFVSLHMARHLDTNAKEPTSTPEVDAKLNNGNDLSSESTVNQS